MWCNNQAATVTHYYAGVQDYICPADPRDVTTALQYAEEPDPLCSLEFLEMARYVMNVHHILFPDTLSAAILDNAMWSIIEELLIIDTEMDWYLGLDYVAC